MKLHKNLKMKLVTALIGTGLLTTVIVTPLAIFSNKNINKIKSSALINSMDYESYLSKTNLSAVDQIINKNALSLNYEYSNVLIKNDNYLRTENIIKKARIIAKELFNKKISLNKLMNKLIEKEKTLSSKQKNYINNTIKKQLIHLNYLNEKHVNSINNFKCFMCCQNLDNLSSSEINAATQEQRAVNELKIVGSVSTSAAIASTAIAAAIWIIPIYGLIEEGFATADTVADWAASGVTWALYNNLHNNVNQIMNIVNGVVSSGIGSVTTPYDIYQMIMSIKSTYLSRESAVISSITADVATNLAGSTAEPEIAPWVEPILDTAIVILDGVTDSLSALTIIQG